MTWSACVKIIAKIGLKEEYKSNEGFKQDLVKDYEALTPQQKTTKEGRETKEAIDQTTETMKEFVH